jgi:hypothetical protein
MEGLPSRARNRSRENLEGRSRKIVIDAIVIEDRALFLETKSHPRPLRSCASRSPEVSSAEPPAVSNCVCRRQGAGRARKGASKARRRENLSPPSEPDLERRSHSEARGTLIDMAAHSDSIGRP